MKPSISTEAENLVFMVEVTPFSKNCGENFYKHFSLFLDLKLSLW